MSVIFSTEELIAMDRVPIPVTDLDVVSLGDEFDFNHEFDLSDLECHPLLAADLPQNSELSERSATSPK